jgi:hypothetical protein
LVVIHRSITWSSLRIVVLQVVFTMLTHLEFMAPLQEWIPQERMMFLQSWLSLDPLGLPQHLLQHHCYKLQAFKDQPQLMTYISTHLLSICTCWTQHLVMIGQMWSHWQQCQWHLCIQALLLQSSVLHRLTQICMVTNSLLLHTRFKLLMNMAAAYEQRWRIFIQRLLHAHGNLMLNSTTCQQITPSLHNTLPIMALWSQECSWQTTSLLLLHG